MNDKERWTKLREMITKKADIQEGMMLLADEVSLLDDVLVMIDRARNVDEPNETVRLAFLERQLNRARHRAGLLVQELDY